MNNDPVFMRIEELRIQQKVSQAELISQLGMARGTYFHWKLGDNLSYYSHIGDISKILRVSSGFLIDGPEPAPEEAMTPADEDDFEMEELIQLFHKLDPDNQMAFMTLLRSLCNS